MDDNQIIKILEFNTIAIVGLSNKNHRPSYQIFKYLNLNKYNTIPVNPNYRIIENKKCYPDLESINEPIDTVNIFRRSKYVLPIIESAVKINAKAIWMQDGVINENTTFTCNAGHYNSRNAFMGSHNQFGTISNLRKGI